MKSVIFLLCLIPLISGKAVDEASTKCLVAHLRNNGFLGGKGAPKTELSDECIKIVQEARREEIEELREGFLSDRDLRHATNCVIAKMEKTDYFDRQLIKKLDKSKAKINQKQVEQSDNLKYLTNMLQITRSFKSCEFIASFNEEKRNRIKARFATSFDTNSADDVDNETDYCLRKHLIDNHLITFNGEKLKVNPNQIDTSTINCDALYQQYMKDAQDFLIESSERLVDDEENPEAENDPEVNTWRKCYRKYTSEKGTLEELLQFDYVQELGLSTEQKTQLSEIFAETIFKVMKTLLDCAEIPPSRYFS